MKKKYLINSFYFQKQLFEKYLSEQFDFYFSPGLENLRVRAAFYVPINIINIIYLYLSKKIKKYDILQFNRSEAFWLFNKIPNQLSIFEIHGFDVGVNGKIYLQDLHNKFKYYLGLLIDKIISKKIIRNIHKVDLFYCSTPDLVEPIYNWCGRKPVWLPNPIDFSLFTPNGNTDNLPGNPACFLAARLHGDKKPGVAIDIFINHIKKAYPEATLHLLNTGELAEKYKNELVDKKTYFWYDYMSKEELASKIRGADLVFGDFSIGALSLLPMQVMALKKPIVTLDNYEVIKIKTDELANLSIKLLRDEEFRNNFIERNYNYIIKTHDPKEIAMVHYENIKKILK